MFNTVYSALYHDFAHLEQFAKHAKVVHSLGELVDTNSILVLHGGGDIAPVMYGDSASPFCNIKTPSKRDEFEFFLAKRAIDLGIPIFGICRGAQMLQVVLGGKLFHHVDNHHVQHDMVTSDGQRFRVSSIHHQMLDLNSLPSGVTFDLMGWTPTPRSSVYMKGRDTASLFQEKEPELVYFPQSKSIAVQPHPETESKVSPLNVYLHNFLTKTFSKENT